MPAPLHSAPESEAGTQSPICRTGDRGTHAEDGPAVGCAQPSPGESALLFSFQSRYGSSESSNRSSDRAAKATQDLPLPLIRCRPGPDPHPRTRRIRNCLLTHRIQPPICDWLLWFHPNPATFLPATVPGHCGFACCCCWRCSCCCCCRSEEHTSELQ